MRVWVFGGLGLRERVLRVCRVCIGCNCELFMGFVARLRFWDFASKVRFLGARGCMKNLARANPHFTTLWAWEEVCGGRLQEFRGLGFRG